jgi:RND family efflux transporter MFP subunit
MTRKRIVTIVSIVAVGVLLIKGRALLKARQEAIAQTPPPQARMLEVNLTRALPGTMRPEYRFNAELRALRTVAVSTRLIGYVTAVEVSEAQHVKKGDVLVRIDESDIRSDIATLEKTLEAQQAEIKHAREVYENNIAVYKAGGLSKEKLEASRIAYELKAAQAESTRQKLLKARHQLEYALVKAPFDGTIDVLKVHKGDLAAPGRALLIMSETKYKLLFSCAPELAQKLRRGWEVAAEGERIGNIEKIHTAAQNALALVEVKLHRPLALPVGAFLPVTVYGEEEKGCTLPSDALLYRKNGAYVLLYDAKNKRFTPRKVEVAVATPEKTLIRSCMDAPLARGSEATLSKLQSLKNVTVRGLHDAKR